MSLFLTASAWAQIVITPANLPAATVNSFYSQTFTGSGGSAPYSYQYTGTLPAGVGLSSTGVLSGLPTEAGTFSFTLVATDSNATIGAQAYLLVVDPPTTFLNPVSLSNATVGVPYGESITASGGIAPYSFHVSGGSFPPGLTLSSSGNLTGMPTAGGTYTFTISANGSSTGAGAPHGGSRSYTMSISAAMVTLPGTTLSDAMQGSPYSAALNSASGGTEPYSYAVTTGALPAGLSLNSNGTLTGTPSQSGDFNFEVVATDSSSGTGPYTSAPRGISLRVVAVSPPMVGMAFATVAQNSTSNPITLSISATPPATSVAVATQATHGTATAVGTTISYTPANGYTGPDAFTYTATNAGGTSSPATVSIVVDYPNIVVNAQGSWSAQVGQPFTQTLVWSGGTSPYDSFDVTGMPDGVTVTGTTANSVTISGTPTAAGPFNINARARDSSTGAGPFTVDQLFPMFVAAPTLNLLPGAGALPAATYGAAFAQGFSSSGGVGPYTYGISGSLPAGLSFNTATGQLSGIPEQVGLFNFTVSVSDSSTGMGPFSTSQNYSLQVTGPVFTISPASLPVATAGTYFNQALSTSGGIGPYSYSLFNGPLPQGVTLSASGVISGTPTESGTFNIAIETKDANNLATQALYTWVVNPAAITLSSSGSLDGTAGSLLSATITASGGIAPYSFALISGTLPLGVSFNSLGVLTGTPRSDGNYSLQVRATDQTGSFSERTFLYTIAPATIIVTPPVLPGGTSGTPYSYTLTSAGGIAPYTYAIASGNLPVGTSFSSNGVLSGTPTTPGSYTANIRSTDNAGYNTTVAYTIVISAPTITLAASAPFDGVVGAAQSSTITATGGTGPYRYSVVAGALPVGMSLSSSGVFSGTPVVSGSFNLTLRATDRFDNEGEQTFAYTIAAPAITVAPGTLGNGVRGTAFSQALSASGGIGAYSFAVSAGALPAGVSLSNAGVLSGTPTVDGAFNFTVTATDAYGFTGAQAYAWTIAAAPPTTAEDTAHVLSGASVSIDVTDNDVGVITSIAVVTPPTHGTATVNGLNVEYTPAAGYSGEDSFTYTATGPGGTSAAATVTVTVNPVPVAVSRTINAAAGIAVEVELTEGATGGPFTGAALVSLSPAQAGTATIAQQGTGDDARYVLTFTPAAAFSGVATATFTLDNAFATSAEASIEFQVTSRPDPTLDAEVQGLLNAQAQATRRFASAQLNNFQRRLESLHHGGTGFSNGVTFQANTPHCRDGMQGAAGAQSLPNQLCNQQTSERDGVNPGLRDASAVDAGNASQSNNPFGLWTGGAIRSGNQDSRNNRARVDFETDGLSVGGDYRVNDRFAIGLGLGWGRDDSEIGNQGSRSEGKAYTLAGYASYHPGKLFLDALVGYQDLSYELRRYVTANGGHVSGSRDGGQWFASLSTGADLQYASFKLTPYARLDLARATLDGYTEQGDALYALHYQDMDVDSSTGNLGLRMDFQKTTSWGALTPQLRLEYQYDFQGNGSATMQYADLMSGPFYRTSLPVFDRSRFLLGIGLGFNADNGLSTRIEYNGVVDDSNGTDHGVMLNIEKRY
ncbi:putative Ig domain-containing protein [Pseudoxanthomonas indica]|nr:putative Ig domain-containing protein [Pseudoxanthomonas indica]